MGYYVSYPLFFLKRITMTKRKSNAKSRQADFDNFLYNNPIVAIPTEYNRNQKTFSVHDMVNIQPMTRNQELVFDLYADGYSLILNGFAGCGKTFLSIYLALNDILDKDSPYEKLLIIRSASPTKEQGFLPGTLEEKQAIFEMPYAPIFDKLFKKKNQYKFMKEAGLVEFESTSYMRGVTLDNTIVVFDEVSSATYHEISTIITRLGKNSKLLFCGDTLQNDLVYNRQLQSGYEKFISIANMIPEFRTVHFKVDDCVRSDFVKSFLVAEQRYIEQNGR